MHSEIKNKVLLAIGDLAPELNSIRVAREAAGFDYAFVILSTEDAFDYTNPEILASSQGKDLIQFFASYGYRIRIESVLYRSDMAPITIPVLFVLWGEDLPDTKHFGTRNWSRLGDVYFEKLPKRHHKRLRESCIGSVDYQRMASIAADVYSSVSVTYTPCANGCICDKRIKIKKPNALIMWFKRLGGTK